MYTYGHTLPLHDALPIFDRAPCLDHAAATALADPQLDLATPMKGPFAAIPVIAPDLAAAALQLARIAGILPAFFVRTDAADSEVSITPADIRSEEHTSELQSLMRISYAVFCLKKKKRNTNNIN